MSAENNSTSPIMFGLINGRIWARFSDDREPIDLGKSEPVIYMMRDFLAQCELGKRLSMEFVAKRLPI